MRHPNPEMLLRIAQADAYAVAYEYVVDKDAPNIRGELLKFERFHQHPTYHKLPAGTYTDDTQMSIAVAETLLLGHEPTANDFTNSFYEAFKRDPRDGYSRALQEIMEQVKSADELRTRVVPTSNSNGAAMRSVPLGIIKSAPKMGALAGIQASATHATWGGINSSIAVAMMSHFALYDHRSFASMYDWCCRQLPAFEWFKEPWSGRVAASNDKSNLGIGMMTAHAVHTLLASETTLMGIMHKVIEWGGDTDSVASIAWGIASARFRNEKLPDFLEQQLEPGGNYGAAYLRDLGNRLMKL